MSASPNYSIKKNASNKNKIDWVESYLDNRVDCFPFSEKKATDSQMLVEMLRRELAVTKQKLEKSEKEKTKMKEVNAAEVKKLKVRVLELEAQQEVTEDYFATQKLNPSKVKLQNLIVENKILRDQCRLKSTKEQNEGMVDSKEPTEQTKVMDDELKVAKVQIELEERVEEIARLHTSLQYANERWMEAEQAVEAKQEQLDKARDLFKEQGAQVDELRELLASKDREILNAEKALIDQVFEKKDEMRVLEGLLQLGGEHCMMLQNELEEARQASEQLKGQMRQKKCARALFQG